jgi:DNA-binding MarR family transcriptional regulator
LKSGFINLSALIKLVENIKGNMKEGETLGTKQIDTLLVIFENKNISITEIANEMNVSPPSVSALTEKLINKGLIKRTYNQLDRRVVTVNLTESGELLASSLQKKQEKIISNLQDFLTKEDIHNFNCLLNKMNSL